MKTLYFPPYPSAPYAAIASQPAGLPFAATIGFFDGVHRGHRFLIEQLKQAAAQQGLRTMVITFDRHPRQTVQPQWQPQLLTTLEEKELLIEQTGIDRLVVLRFDEQMAALSARDFMQQVLKEQLGVRLLLTGYDNRFGHNREEGFEQYRAYGQQTGIEVVAALPSNDGDMRYSSSLARRLIAEGDMGQAARCLGRRYTIAGLVVHGEQIGRTLGFPTANIAIGNPELLVPANGVYAVTIERQGHPTPYGGMMNIGMRPTFDGHRRTLEVNIFGFRGDLYGERLTIVFIARLREEQHFDSPEALARQMAEDAERAKAIINEQTNQ